VTLPSASSTWWRARDSFRSTSASPSSLTGEAMRAGLKDEKYVEELQRRL
jgi:hypothetical protein